MQGRIEQDEWGNDVIVHEADIRAAKAVADSAKRLRIDGHHGDKEMRHLAEFPGIVVQAYCDNNGITWQEWVANPDHARRMMKDPALSDFLIWNGGRA